MKRKGIILIPLIVLFLPLFLSTFHKQNSGTEFQISVPLKNNQNPVSNFRGRIQTLAIDEIDKSTGKLKCRFVHYLKSEDGRLYQIEDAKGALKKIKPSEQVGISGGLIDRKIIVDKVRLLPSTRETATTETTSDTLGEQKTLVALFNFPDDTSEPFTIQDAEDKIINNPDSTDKFFRENSYGKAWLNADFIDWQTLPHNSTYYTDSSLLDDAIDTLDPLVNFQDYARLIFIYRTEAFGSARSSLGKSELNSSGDGPFTASAIWLWASKSLLSVLSSLTSHELGHSFGFSHASSIATEGPYFIPESIIDPTSSPSTTYGEGYDRSETMGGHIYYRHFSTIWKSDAEWIDSSQMQEATKSGEYTIDQVELSSTGTKALKIPIGKDTYQKDIYYWVEYRKNLGAFDGADQPDESGIIQIRTKSTSTYVGKWTANSIRFEKQVNIVHLTPVQMNEITEVAAISAGGGFGHSLALKLDGTVWAWGLNDQGQLGDGTILNRKTPIQVNGLSDIIAISAGVKHSLALKSGGTVWGWGYNVSGQLGDGTYEQRKTPVQVINLSDVVAISAGFYHSLALKSDGTVWAWGHNGYGQLGNGNSTSMSTPTQVSTISGITAISCGGYYSLALKSDGTVWAWGWNNYGQLGDGTDEERRTPVQVSNIGDVIDIEGGGYHSLALKSDGTVWAWGNNSDGQLGNNTTSDSSTPIQVNNLSDISVISGGGYHSLALKLDGTVWAWGDNGNYQLGNGSTTVSYIPIQIISLENINAISGGGYHSLALNSENKVLVWGTYIFDTAQPFTDIDIDEPFYDPYRGVRIKLIEKSGDGAESKVKLSVALSGLNTDPRNILDFGDVRVNSRSSKTVTVTNNSGGDIEFSSVSLGGRTPEFFNIVNDECSNKTLSNGESSNITISFTPDSEGDKFGILQVPNSDPIRSKATISLYGYGSTEVTSTPTPTVTPTPSPTQKPSVLPTPISCDDSYEPNDSKETAYGLLTSGSSYEGKICSNSDVDWYKVNITSAGTISLSLTGPSSNDFDLELYDSSDTLIASSNSGAGADESIHYNVTTTGDYYIKVYEFYGSYNSTTPYTLTYSFVNTVSSPSPVTTPTPSCTDNYESNDSFGTAYGPLYPQSSYQGKICSPVDVDYFKITVTGPGIISITQSVPLGKDYDLFLYDASQSLIASSSLGTVGVTEAITYFANTAGTYYIQVVGYGGSYNENQVYILSYTWQPMTTVTPIPPECGVKSIGVIPGKLKIQKDKSKDITVTVTGTDDCQVEGTKVTAKITVGKNRISILPISQSADEDGKATFKVTAGNTSGRARIMFVAGDTEKILAVKIK